MNWIQKKNKAWQEQMAQKKHRVRLLLGMTKAKPEDHRATKDKAHKILAEKRKMAFKPKRHVKKPMPQSVGFWDLMRMREIPREPPKSPFESGAGFKHFLEKRGFKRLGGGSFSTVLAKPDQDRVIKVGYRPDPWFDYIQWANENGYGGTFAPKVYSYKYFAKSPKPFYVAVVERLHKTANHLKPEDKNYFVHNLMSLHMSYKNDWAGKCLEIVQPGINKFGLDFRTKFHDRRYDLHGDNFMVRKDGSYVMTDPLAGDHVSNINRWKAANDNIQMKVAA